MQEVDFFKLPRAVQDRIIGGMRGEFPPSPLARIAARPAIPWPWIALAASGALALIVLLTLGYGQLNARGQQGAAFLIAEVLAGFALVFGVVGALGTIVRASLVPFPRGTFLYATRILLTERLPVRTLPLEDPGSVTMTGTGVTVSSPQGALVFTCDAMQAAAALSVIQEVATSRAAQPIDNEFVDEHDPLHEPRFNSPFGASEPLTPQIPAWSRFGWAIALGVGAVIGGATFAARNAKSDKRMVLLAREANTVTAYRAYLEHGKRFKDEVERVYLPRAELSEAIAIGTPEAILAFEAAHPGVAIGQEVQDAKRAALIAELDRRERTAELGKVRAFSTDYPGSGLDAEVALAVGRLYRSIAERVQGKSPQGALFLSSALAYAEKHGPKALLVWDNKPSRNLGNLEQVLVRVPEYMGEMDKPSTHFKREQLAERGQRFAETFAKELAAVIPPEYLQLETGPAQEGVPVLRVVEQIDWSGYTLRAKKPRGVYVGLTFSYDVSGSVPGSASYKLHTTQNRRITEAMLKPHDKDAAGSYEGKLYEALQLEAHNELQKKLTTELLQP